MDKKQSRMRRAVATRRKIAELRVHRLSVHRTNTHIYASIISPEGDRVLASASTVETEVRKELAVGSNVAAASLVGKRVAEKAKALAEAAREAGLKF